MMYNVHNNISESISVFFLGGLNKGEGSLVMDVFDTYNQSFFYDTYNGYFTRHPLTPILPLKWGTELNLMRKLYDNRR